MLEIRYRLNEFYFELGAMFCIYLHVINILFRYYIFRLTIMIDLKDQGPHSIVLL